MAAAALVFLCGMTTLVSAGEVPVSDENGMLPHCQPLMKPDSCPAIPPPSYHVSQNSNTVVQSSTSLAGPLQSFAKVAGRSAVQVLRLSLRAIVTLLVAFWQLVSILAAPFKSLYRHLVASPISSLYTAACSVKPLFLFICVAVLLGAIAGILVGYFLRSSIAVYSTSWRPHSSTNTHVSESSEASSSESRSPSPPAPRVQIYSSKGDLLEEDIDDLELAPSLSCGSRLNSQKPLVAKHVSWAPILEHTSRARSSSPSPSSRKRIVGARRRARKASSSPMARESSNSDGQ